MERYAVTSALVSSVLREPQAQKGNHAHSSMHVLQTMCCKPFEQWARYRTSSPRATQVSLVQCVCVCVVRARAKATETHRVQQPWPQAMWPQHSHQQWCVSHGSVLPVIDRSSQGGVTPSGR